MREPLRTLRSHAMVLPVANIDTDQIVPARFLTTTSREGLGQHAFADWRGAPESAFADTRAASAQILIAGDNFGCGSSREHAPWALLDFGFRAVVSSSFADIFHNNALKNGLLPVTIAPDVHSRLLATQWPQLTIDVTQSVCQWDEVRAPYPIDTYEQDCLLQGRDDFDQLLARLPEIEAFEEARR